MQPSVLHPGGQRLTFHALSFCEPLTGFWVDIGCGYGESVRALTDTYGVVAVGLDVSEQTVQKATEYGGTFVCADAHSLPFFDDSVDGILMECSFCLMRDAKAVIAECLRVLKSGGLLCISDMYAKNEDVGAFKNSARLYTRDEISAILKGFSIRHFEDCSDTLRQFWGQLILEQGREALCQQWNREELKRAEAGYYMLIAKRDER